MFQWTAKIQQRASCVRCSRRRPIDSPAANTAELVRLVQSPDREVSSEAIRRAGALKAQAAVLALSKILGEPDVARRLLAVQALAEIGSPGALQALERSDRRRRSRRPHHRRARVTARAYRPVLARLEAVVKGKAIRDADLTEKMAFFEAYGALCGDGGVSQLDAMLNGKGFLGRREDPEDPRLRGDRARARRNAEARSKRCGRRRRRRTSSCATPSTRALRGGAVGAVSAPS